MDGGRELIDCCPHTQMDGVSVVITGREQKGEHPLALLSLSRSKPHSLSDLQGMTFVCVQILLDRTTDCLNVQGMELWSWGRILPVIQWA